MSPDPIIHTPLTRKSFPLYHHSTIYFFYFFYSWHCLYYCHDRQRHGYCQRSRRRSQAWATPTARPPRSVGPRLFLVPFFCSFSFVFFAQMEKKCFFFFFFNTVDMQTNGCVQGTLQYLVFRSIYFSMRVVLWVLCMVGFSLPVTCHLSQGPEELAPFPPGSHPPPPTPTPTPRGLHVGLSIIHPGVGGGCVVVIASKCCIQMLRLTTC